MKATTKSTNKYRTSYEVINDFDEIELDPNGEFESDDDFQCFVIDDKTEDDDFITAFFKNAPVIHDDTDCMM